MILRMMAPLGCQKMSPAPAILNAEEVQLLAQQAMVAFGRFFQAGEVGVEFLLREERSAVDALQLRILLVAQPVCAGQGEDFEGLDAAGGGQMRPAAKVDELAVAIEADLVAGHGELGHEVGLHEVAVAVEAFQAFISCSKFMDKGSSRATTSAILASMAPGPRA
jgi:hypothetical protein